MITSIKSIAYFFVAAFVIVGLVGCDKEDEGTPKLQLTGKQWNMTSWISTPPYEVEGQMISNIYTLLPTCSHDDFLLFNTDASMVRDEGEVKCNENEPQTTTGNWLMNSNQTILKITIEESETDYEIGEVSDNYLILKTEEVIEDATGSVTYEYVFTYTRM